MKKVVGPLIGLVIIGLIVWFSWGKISLFKGSSSSTNQPKPLPPPPTYETKPFVGFLAPDFDLKSIDGKDIQLGGFLGKVVVIDFWATWCPFCQSEMPNLARFASSEPNDVVVIAINRAELPQTVSDFTKTYVSPPSNMYVVLDPDDSIYKRYLGSTMPESFYIDRDGVIRSLANRELLLGEMRDAARPLIAAPSACHGKKYGQGCP